MNISNSTLKTNHLELKGLQIFQFQTFESHI